MQWSDVELEDGFIERRITFAGTNELARFRKIIPEAIPATHYLHVEYVKSRQQGGLPELIIAPRPLTLERIAKKTKDFAELDLLTMRTLLKRERLELPTRKDGDPQLDEAAAILKVLREALAGKATRKPVPVPKQKPLVVPDELAGLSPAECETKAARLGVVTEYTKARKRSPAAGLAVLAAAMIEQDKKEQADKDAEKQPETEPAPV